MMAAAAAVSRWVARAHHADGRLLAIELFSRGMPSAEQFAAAALRRARELGLARNKARRRHGALAQLAQRGVTITAIRPGAPWAD